MKRKPSVWASLARSAPLAVTLLFAPIIPALNDSELETILASSREAGATAAAYMLLRLPLEIRELFFEWLHQHYPLRAEHVISVLRQSRGGEDYDSRFGHRMRGTGVFAELLEQRFKVACKRLQLRQGENTSGGRTDLFSPPPKASGEDYGHRQIDMF